MSKFDTSRPFRPWLMRIAYNVWADWGREQARAPAPLPGAGVAGVQPAPGAGIDKEEFRLALRDALATLEPEELMFYLLWEEGLGQLKGTEIKFWLGCSDATVTRIKTATLAKLASFLTARGFE